MIAGHPLMSTANMQPPTTRAPKAHPHLTAEPATITRVGPVVEKSRKDVCLYHVDGHQSCFLVCICHGENIFASPRPPRHPQLPSLPPEPTVEPTLGTQPPSLSPSSSSSPRPHLALLVDQLLRRAIILLTASPDLSTLSRMHFKAFY
jgi:hypothetical protein